MLKKSKKNSTKVKPARHRAVKFPIAFAIGFIIFSLTAIYLIPNLFSIDANRPPDPTPIAQNLAAAKPQKLPPRTQSNYLGINNGTGYNTDPKYVARSIQHTKALGLEVVRMGMDGIWGNTKGANFEWSTRDAVVKKYLQAKIQIHAVIAPRGHVTRDPNYKQWQANYDYFVRNVMRHYKGKIFYYIVDNEPDIDYGNGKMSAQECVDMTRIAFKAARAIDPRIKIESPPVKGIDAPLLAEMLDVGIDKVSDYIGLHAYGGQIHEGRFGHPWQVLAERGVKKPLAISEAGAIASWCEGTNAEKEDCRRRWFAYFGQQLKRFGYDHAILFDLDGHDEWAVAPNFQPTKSYQQIANLRLERPLADRGFESINNVESEWVPFRGNDIGASPYVNFVRGDAAGARSGKGYVRLESGKAGGDTPINVRRIIARLPSGKKVRLGAWVYVSGEGNATLKALGYDRLDGDAEISKTSTKKNTWEYLEIAVPISKSWTVVELGTTGTGKTGNYVKWDDVVLRTA